MKLERGLYVYYKVDQDKSPVFLHKLTPLHPPFRRESIITQLFCIFCMRTWFFTVGSKNKHLLFFTNIYIQKFRYTQRLKENVTKVTRNLQWNLDISKGQGIAMFRYIEVLFHIFYYISGVKKIVLYTSLYKGSLYRGSTVIIFSNDKTFSVEAMIIFAWLQRLVYNRVSRWLF